MQEQYQFERIGTIRTPYRDSAPFQPVHSEVGDAESGDIAEGNSFIVLDEQYREGLSDLEKFRYIYVLYYLHEIKSKPRMTVNPPWAGAKNVGLFSSRSPVRPNPIGLSIVRIRKIVGNIIYTSDLDVFDETPLLDIKPYIKDLDSKADANYGWLEEMDDMEHLALHIAGIPHDY